MVLCFTDAFTKYVEDLLIWHTLGDHLGQRQRIQKQTGNRALQKTQY